jgi:Domain of unknown function (DUF6265)
MLLVVVLVMGRAPVTGAAAGDAWQPAGVAVPVWMAGCWAGQRGGERFFEHWVAADPSTLLSVAHTTKDGRMTAFEFLRVTVRDGKVLYIAQPNGRPPTEFTATSLTADRVVFENPAHDFPKRVIYQRKDADWLSASIDGGSETANRVVYEMARQPCEK